METMKRSVVARACEEGGGTGGARGIFRAVKLLCMRHKGHVITRLSRSPDRTVPRVSPNVDSGLRACPSRVILGKFSEYTSVQSFVGSTLIFFKLRKELGW